MSEQSKGPGDTNRGNGGGGTLTTTAPTLENSTSGAGKRKNRGRGKGKGKGPVAGDELANNADGTSKVNPPAPTNIADPNASAAPALAISPHQAVVVNATSTSRTRPLQTSTSPANAVAPGPAITDVLTETQSQAPDKETTEILTPEAVESPSAPTTGARSGGKRKSRGRGKGKGTGAPGPGDVQTNTSSSNVSKEPTNAANTPNLSTSTSQAPPSSSGYTASAVPITSPKPVTDTSSPDPPTSLGTGLDIVNVSTTAETLATVQTEGELEQPIETSDVGEPSSAPAAAAGVISNSGKRKNKRKGKNKKAAAPEVVSTAENTTGDGVSSNTAVGDGKGEEAGNGMANTTDTTSSAAAGPSSKQKGKAKQSPPPEPQTQYHHFIPRLVLREFATSAERAAEPRNPFVKVYSLEDATITPTRVARCYGHFNMYQDFSSTDVMHIEKSLAQLERTASGVVSQIKKAYEQGASSVKLTRIERNQVRKFLFVMKYRSPLFWAKYNRSVEEYDHKDRPAVLEFMREKNFSKPLEVWLHTLKAIIDTPIDDKEEWRATIMDTCFAPDGMWFVFNMGESFMAFCMPQDPATDEFIVSESAFGIHEGPTESDEYFPDRFKKSRKKTTVGEAKVDLSSELRLLNNGYGWYTEYHKMAPFSPKLLLVLRSNYLRDEESKEILRKMGESGIPGSHQFKVPSLFDHLHLDPPVPSYVNKPSLEIDGKPLMVQYSDKDEFTFTLHKLSHKDVVLFNSIIFSNVRRNLTWQNDEAMRRSLEEYLKEKKFLLPQFLPFFSGKEEMEKLWEVERRQQLHRLLEILKGHPGKGTEIPAPPVSRHVEGLTEFEENFMKNSMSEGYLQLGGTGVDFMRDMFQSSIVSQMRNNIADALPKGPHRLPYRQAVSRTKMAFFATLPPTVIYLHVTIWMMVQANRQAGPSASTKKRIKEITEKMMLSKDGPHDAVVKISAKVPRQHLSKWMLHASVRRVSQQERGEKTANTEFTIFSTFGGLVSSFLIESTPWYDPSIDHFMLDPYRPDDRDVISEMFKREMIVRWKVKTMGVIEAIWGPEVDEFVWKWLYEGPK